LNTQDYGFQFGVNVGLSSPAFRAHTRITAPFAGITPQLHSSMGLFIGTRDQDNYIKLDANSDGPQGALQFSPKIGGVYDSSQQTLAPVFGADSIDFYIEIDPANLTAKPLYKVTINGVTGPLKPFGNAISFPSNWLTGSTKLAVGIISTSYGATPFSATWDMIEVVPMYSDDGGAGTPSNFVALEVEHYDGIASSSGHDWVTSNLLDFSSTDSMITTPDNGTIKSSTVDSTMLSHIVNFPTAGTYYVWARGWGDTNSSYLASSDSFHVGLNGVLSSTADNIDQFPAGSWNWTNDTTDPAVATLSVPSAGPQTVNIWMREDGLALDRLEFTTDVTYTPTGNGFTAGALGNTQNPIRNNAGGPQIIANGVT
jgi:hypothetical protein